MKCIHGPVECRFCAKVKKYKMLLKDDRVGEVAGLLAEDGFLQRDHQDSIIEFIREVDVETPYSFLSLYKLLSRCSSK